MQQLSQFPCTRNTQFIYLSGAGEERQNNKRPIIYQWNSKTGQRQTETKHKENKTKTKSDERERISREPDRKLCRIYYYIYIIRQLNIIKSVRCIHTLDNSDIFRYLSAPQKTKDNFGSVIIVCCGIVWKVLYFIKCFLLVLLSVLNIWMLNLVVYSRWTLLNFEFTCSTINTHRRFIFFNEARENEIITSVVDIEQ